MKHTTKLQQQTTTNNHVDNDTSTTKTQRDNEVADNQVGKKQKKMAAGSPVTNAKAIDKYANATKASNNFDKWTKNGMQKRCAKNQLLGDLC